MGVSESKGIQRCGSGCNHGHSFDVLFEFLTVLKKYIFIADGANGRRYIEMRYVFEDFDFNDFEVLERILLLLEEMEHDG